MTKNFSSKHPKRGAAAPSTPPHHTDQPAPSANAQSSSVAASSSGVQHLMKLWQY
jgi:hypothetical protein